MRTPTIKPPDAMLLDWHQNIANKAFAKDSDVSPYYLAAKRMRLAQAVSYAVAIVSLYGAVASPLGSDSLYMLMVSVAMWLVSWRCIAISDRLHEDWADGYESGDSNEWPAVIACAMAILMTIGFVAAAYLTFVHYGYNASSWVCGVTALFMGSATSGFYFWRCSSPTEADEEEADATELVPSGV